MGSGCGSVGKAVASEATDPRVGIQSSANFISCQLFWKDKIKKKRPGMEWPNLKKSNGYKRSFLTLVRCQCDQIGRFFGLWATF